MANFMAMALARDVHLRAPHRARTGRRAARASRASASTRATRPTSRSPARSTSSGFPPETLRRAARPTTTSGCGPHRSPRLSTATAPRGCGRSPSPPSPGSTNTGLRRPRRRAGRPRRARGPVAPRRRGVRRRGAPVRARRRPRAGPRARATRVTIDPHKWFFQAYDIGALVVRDGGRPPTDVPPRRPSTTAAARDRRPRGPRRRHGQLNFYQLGIEGTPPVPCPEAVDELEAPRHAAASAAWSRPTTTSPPTSRRAAPRRTTSRRCRPSPELSVVCFRHLPRRAAAAHVASRRPHARRAPGPAPAALEASGDGWLSTTTLRGRTYLRAGIVNYLTTEADIDRLLDDAARPRPGGVGSRRIRRASRRVLMDTG